MKKGVQFKKLFVVGDKKEQKAWERGQEKEILHYINGPVPRLARIHSVSNPDMVGFKLFLVS